MGHGPGTRHALAFPMNHIAAPAHPTPWAKRRKICRRNAMDVRWRHMSSAPRDGSRILVTVRPSEQGPADVDVAYWARADQFGSEGWRAADSYPGLVVGYAEPEMKCWMPLPKAGLGQD